MFWGSQINLYPPPDLFFQIPYDALVGGMAGGHIDAKISCLAADK